MPAATGSTAASDGDTADGRCAANPAVTRASGANPPCMSGQPPNTSSPTAKPDTAGPSAATVPATSRPSTAGATGP